MKTKFRSAEDNVAIHLDVMCGEISIWRFSPSRPLRPELVPIPADIAIEVLSAALALARGAEAEPQTLEHEP